MRQQQPSLLLSVLVVSALLSGSHAFAPSMANSRPFLPQHVSREAGYSSRPITLQSNDPRLSTRSRNHGSSSSSSSSSISSSGTSSTSLNMISLPAGAALAAITGAISGGFFAGGLHAIAGPDHLAALLPRCVGQRWYRAGRAGALWGMGHGVSATIIGVMAFALKKYTFRNASDLRKFFNGASHVTEIAVGLSLIVIGIMGIREAREWKEEMDTVQPQSLSAAATEAGVIKSSGSRAVIFNGLLHGFSWDGAPSLAPAIAVATWSGNLAFLSAYAIGTMATMAIVTILIGEGTRKAGQFFDRPDIPQKLSFFSSALAIAIGGIWCGLAFI